MQDNNWHLTEIIEGAEATEGDKEFHIIDKA